MIGSGSIFSAALALVGIAPRNLSPMPVTDNGRPTMAVSPRKPGASVPHRIRTTSTPHPHRIHGADNNRIHTGSAHVLRLPGPAAKAVELKDFSNGLLHLGPARAGTGPRSQADAVAQFVDLMTEAVWRRFLPPEIRFSGLQEYYGVLVIGFGWPEISQKTLSMLLVAHGAERLERRKRINGKDTRRVIFRFPEFEERAAA